MSANAIVSNPYPETDPATRWAWDVVNGRVTSGHLAIRACQRHLDDIEHGPRRGIHWRPERAEHALNFFPAMLRVTAGAMEGHPFELPSYTAFVVGSLFGWVREDGRLRFRRAWVETGKGQIKSPLAAAIGIYTMAFRGIARSECYAIAKDRQQANVLFADAVAMVNAPIGDRDDDASLVSTGVLVARGTGDMTWMVEHPASMSKFRALAGDEKVSGPRPSFVAADEIHEWRNDGPLRTWRSAGAKMPGDFLLLMSTNTPAADQIVGTEYSAEYQRILRGEVEDDAAFAFIARVDDGNHWETLTFGRAMRYMVKSCSCHSVSTTQIEELKAEVFVGRVIPDGIDLRADRDAQSIQISQSSKLEYAPSVLEKIKGQNHQKLKYVIENTKSNGQLLTPKSLENTIGNGEPHDPLDIDWSGFVLGNLEYLRQIITPSLSSNTIDADRAAEKQKPSASIIATKREKLEVSCVNHATRESVFSETLSKVWNAHSPTCEVRKGKLEGATLRAYLPADDPLTDESCWQKAMPCLGLTFPIDNVRIEVNSARHSVGTMLNTKRLYFGIPVGTSEYWIELEAWEAVQGRVGEAEMRGKPCWLGMDLAQKNDLAALGAVWRGDEGKYYSTCRYWKPADGLADKAREDNAPYVEWATQGLLNTTPGKSIDYDFIAVEIQKFCAEQDVEAMAFDPAHIGEFRQACERIGFATWVWEPDEYPGSGLKMIVHSQGKMGMHSKKALWMPRSLGQLEDLILTEQIVIDESPVTKWCAGNAAIKPDEFGNRYLIKKHTRGRIDGIVAKAMAVGAALADDAAVEIDIEAMVA